LHLRQIFEPLAKWAGVGQKSLDELIRKGLAVEDDKTIHGRTFKITEKGWLALSWIQRRLQV
jgi:predicted transcriptional regulator